ncbi:MAG: ABC transporter substrate-binding protein [Bacteroidia bacterium]|nr:ABC transporter substrate-binding protein [Bacteroidia bacterium]
MDSPPEKIVCLVPSITELLFELHLDQQIAGRTKYCILPSDKITDVPVIGGTKYVDLNAIKSINPDLIIANKEENTKDIVVALRKSYRVYVSDVSSQTEALEMINDVATLCNCEQKGKELVKEIDLSFKFIKSLINPVRVCYFIWRKPYMVAAKDTYINSMLELAGFENCFDYLNRYPEIELKDLMTINPDHIFLSSEPFPFSMKHFKEFQEVCPNATITIVDGQMFSWYGSRLKKFSKYINDLYSLLKI